MAEKLEGTVIRYAYEQDGEAVEYKVQIVDKKVREIWAKAGTEWVCLNYLFLQKTLNAASGFIRSKDE